jgi:hypothetical protein
MRAIISKQSIRELTKMSRLPPSIKMFLAGAWLHDILIANSLDQKYKLWSMAYWVTTKSLDNTRLVITWRPID